MFENNDPNAEIKLIDFGLSKAYSPEQKFMNEGVGTIYTMVRVFVQARAMISYLICFCSILSIFGRHLKF